MTPQKKRSRVTRPTPQAASAGGKAVKSKTPPESCTHEGCNQSMNGRTWHSFLGHLGLHGLADRFFNGDLHAAQERLRRNALARTDPTPWNGAYPPYKPVSEPEEAE